MVDDDRGLDLRWRDALLVGDEEIDRQHRAFFADAQAIAAALERRVAIPEILRLTARFRGDLSDHFAAEEAVLERTVYPDRHGHQAEHAALLDSLAAAEALLLRSSLTEDLVAVIEQMLVALVGHVLSFDMRYHSWLTATRNHG
jgi:hemerythrin